MTKPYWPALFIEIIANHNDRRRLMDKSPPTPEEWIELKRLFNEMKAFRAAAQKLLRWNPGGTKGAGAAGVGGW